MKYSFIVPVYNRPDEIEELLASMVKQEYKDFEVIIVEDGSSLRCDNVVEKYKDKLDIRYFYKENEGPAIARNYGAQYATGDYVVFVDSDVILPSQYLKVVDTELTKDPVDVYGGPDAASPDFNALQRAISYSMTAFLTSGNIRGGQKIDRYYPRSFNMGVKLEVFRELGGFPVTRMHPGEDMVFAIELIRRGYRTKLIPEAYVYHKRRNTLKSFYRQVFRFGKTRYIISRVYPETFKIFYLAPSAFALGTIALMALSFWKWYFILPVVFYAVLVFFDSLVKNKCLKVALLSVVTAFVQHFGYGFGFLSAVLRGDEYGVFKTGFYPENTKQKQ